MDKELLEGRQFTVHTYCFQANRLLAICKDKLSVLFLSIDRFTASVEFLKHPYLTGQGLKIKLKVLNLVGKLIDDPSNNNHLWNRQQGQK